MEASPEERARLLKRCVIFRDLRIEDLKLLAAQAVQRKYTSGQTIFSAGDDGDSLLGVVAGSVRITRTTADGDEIILADFGAGDIFGEIALLDGGGRSASAMATANCELLALSRSDFLALLQQRPDLATSIISLLCGKLRSADDRSADLAFLSLGGRLAKAILARSSPTSQHPGGRVSLSQTELANIIGATRPNVNRQLKAWERSGLIAMERGWIVIRNRNALAAEPAH